MSKIEDIRKLLDQADLSAGEVAQLKKAVEHVKEGMYSIYGIHALKHFKGMLSTLWLEMDDVYVANSKEVV